MKQQHPLKQFRDVLNNGNATILYECQSIADQQAIEFDNGSG